MTTISKDVEARVPGIFDHPEHFYPRVLNAQLHPLVDFFFKMGNERIAERYIHLHPQVDPLSVRELLMSQTRHFVWGGTDLLNTTSQDGDRKLLVIETNSCPSGQKSMPFSNDPSDEAGYRQVLSRCFLPALKQRKLPAGDLAVIFDKNPMENEGYAQVMANLTGERVWLVPFTDYDTDPPARFEEGVLQIRTKEGYWRPIRAAWRYVTQKPWTRIPPVTRTLILNPVLSCLAGGRNKMLAAKAYEFFNAHLRDTGLEITTPETIWDVPKTEVPLWVKRMGGAAVVKVPYLNAGQGVYTIASSEDLDRFMERDFVYDRFIVQSLIGNSEWSSKTSQGCLYHVGTVPTRKNQIFAFDLRFMVGSGPEGFFPVALYARRARLPLTQHLSPEASTWDILGTNLSMAGDNHSWTTETNRLLLVDSRDFNRLGLGLDDLINGYVQSVLAMSAIDRMASEMVTKKGQFRRRFFSSVNSDPALVEEICR